MRYAIFTDIHANLEALKAVLAKIDEIAQEEPIDEIWFLGDLVGYGPNPNECIVMLRERTDVMIAGNHDWAAVGKIDLEDFSAAARISAEWTAKELTEEHRTFLSDLPERLQIGDCTLVHGSPYGPLWEYLTSEMLAERSFRHFSSRYCFVGHTHIPVIFQQHISAGYDEELANAPTLPLKSTEPSGVENGTAVGDHTDGDDDETVGAMVVQHVKAGEQVDSAYADPVTHQVVSEEEANAILEPTMSSSTQSITEVEADTTAEAAMDSADQPATTAEEIDGMMTEDVAGHSAGARELKSAPQASLKAPMDDEESVALENVAMAEEESAVVEEEESRHEPEDSLKEEHAEQIDEMSPEAVRLSTEGQASSEIEELLTLLGLSQSMIQITNEMLTPPEGEWQAPEGYRFIINPGGVGQPRDGDPRAAFMIYDTERGFKFYRVPYNIEKTQEKIIKAGLPHYLALRLAYGR
jgi:diadenosine tetraphosphatase ApaH/serine/threonine PP2A family protein phosphatase